MAKEILKTTGGGHASPFEKIKRTNDAGMEFRSSREFSEMLGYGDYRNFEGVIEKAKEKLPARVYSKELIETIFRQPYTKGQFLVDAGIARRQTAAEYLKELERIGILKPHKIGKETLFLNVDLYGLLSK